MPEKKEAHLDLVQAGDTGRIVKWGDHSMTMAGREASAGIQVPAPKPRSSLDNLPQQGRFQGLFKQFLR